MLVVMHVSSYLLIVTNCQTREMQLAVILPLLLVNTEAKTANDKYVAEETAGKTLTKDANKESGTVSSTEEEVN